VTDVSGAPFLAAGDMIPEENVIHAFDSEGNLEDWLLSMGIKDKYDRIKMQNSEIQKLEFNHDHSKLKSQQKRVINDLLSSAPSSSSSPSSITFIPAICEHINFAGPNVPLNGNFPYPRLRWFGFNDKASSAIAAGVCVLYEHDWFKGRNFVVLGRVSYLYDFNDVTSSASADMPIGR
jgi:hypothetical protein